MATGIGNLIINLKANTAGFSKGLSTARGATRRFGGAMGGAIKSIAKYGGALAGIAGVGGLGLVIRSQFKAIDALGKLSQQLGTTTEDLVGLHHAANLTGAGAGAVDAGLKTMAKRLGESARTGSGPAATALKDLGLNLQEIAKKNPADAFREIAGAMGNIVEPTKRNAIAANLFSKANSKLLLTLSAGKEGLAKMEQEAAALGLTVSQADYKKIADATDAVTRVKAAFTGMARRAAIALAPALQKVADAVVKWQPVFRRVIATAVNLFGQAFRFIAEIARGVGAFIADVFRKGFGFVKGLFPGVQTSFRETFMGIVKNLDVMLGSWEGFRSGVIQIATQVSLALEATWEQATSFFKIKWEEAKGWFGTTMTKLGEIGVEKFMPAMSKMFIWMRKKMTELKGEKWLLSPEDEIGIIKGEQKRMLEELAARRTQIENETNKKVAALRAEHEKKMAAIGAKSLEASRKWQEQLGKLPTLSGRVREAWEKAGKAVESAQAAGAGGAGDPFGGIAKQAAGSRQRYAAGNQLGTAAEYSAILAATGGGGTREKIQKATEETAKSNERIARAVEVIAGEGERVIEIPAGGGAN